MALMVGAMTIHGIAARSSGDAEAARSSFWGMIASMWVGNLMLLIINLPLVGIWVRLLRVPYRLMFPSIVIFCSIGIYSVNNAPTDVMLAGASGWSATGWSNMISSRRRCCSAWCSDR